VTELVDTAATPASSPTTFGDRARSTGRFLLRFQSVFGLVAILIVSAIVAPVRNGQNVFLT
jgi:hypothetical protein